MTPSEITKILGITDTKTVKFTEPVKFAQKSGCMPEAQYSITSADITERQGWTSIILRGSMTFGSEPLDCGIKWDQFKAPQGTPPERAILGAGFNA